jgi:hypothetical protein
MAVSISLQNSIVYVQTILKNQSLFVNNQEPALTTGNIVLQRMLGAPFIWRFNRSTITFPISEAGGTDYTQTVSDLGRIETQWLNDDKGNMFELKGSQSIAKVSSMRRPVEVAPVYDDNEGNITFRFNSIPEQEYTANFDYQMKPMILTGPGMTFGPVPDEFGYLFNKGMLCEGALLVSDSRFPIWEKDFIAGMLATQDGLDAQAKNIFYDQMLNNGRTSLRSQGMSQSGIAGRQQ